MAFQCEVDKAYEFMATGFAHRLAYIVVAAEVKRRQRHAVVFSFREREISLTFL